MTGSEESPSLEELYEKYDLNTKFDHPSSITETNSAFGGGDYPPDWNADRDDIDDPVGGRREAVLEYQHYECARCRTDLRQETYFNCHHYRPISEGGKHDLNNLVALCGPCHKLIHPNVNQLDADWRDAPLFPSPRADPRMATVRRPVTDEERDEYLPELTILASTSKEGENQFANSEATISMSPGDALSAATDFERLIDDANIRFDTEYAVRASNQRGGPLFEATVELNATLPGGEYQVTDETDASGIATFTLPEGAAVHGTVSKGEFESAAFATESVRDDKTVEVRLTPIAAATSDDTDATSDDTVDDTDATSDDSSSGISRRRVVTAAAVGAGAVASWELLPRLLPFVGTASSEGSSGEPGGAGAESSETAEPTNAENGAPAPAWVSDIGSGVPLTELVVSDGTIVAGLKTGAVHAISRSGEPMWSADIQDRLADIAVADDTVYAAGRQTIYAATDGTTRWSTRVDEADPDRDISVDVGASHVLATYCDPVEERSFVAVLDRESGERLRTFDPNSSYHETAALRDSRYLFVDRDRVVAFDDPTSSEPTDAGTIKYDESGWVEEILFDENRAYVVYDQSDTVAGEYPPTRLVAFDVPSMTKMWDEPVGSNAPGFATPNGGNVYYNSKAGTAVRFDDSGIKRWTKSWLDATAPPVVLGDTVYVCGSKDDSSALTAHATADGSSRFVARDFETEPRLTTSIENRVLVGTAGGKLYAYDGEESA